MLKNNDLITAIDELIQKRIAEALPLQNVNKKMVSKKEAALLLNISESSINRHLKDGKLHKLSVGGRVFIHRLEVENFIKKG